MNAEDRAEYALHHAADTRARKAYGDKYCALDDRNWISVTDYTVWRYALDAGLVTQAEYDRAQRLEGDHFHYAGD